MPQPVTMNPDQKGMITRLLTNYLGTIGNTLGEHEMATVNYVLTAVQPVLNLGGQDRILAMQLKSAIDNYYRQQAQGV